MKISIVVPAYNEERMIEACVRSLTNQTRMPDEIVVVDNNSKDRTAELAARHGARVIPESRQGISFARTAGFNHAQGDIVLRCDADTIALPTWVADMERAFDKHRADAVTGPCFFHDMRMGGLVGRIHRPAFFWASRVFQGHHALFGSNMGLTKDAWNKVKDDVCLDDKTMHEDVDLACHLHKAGCKIVYDRNVLASISGRRFNDSLRDLTKYTGRWIRTMRNH